MTQHEHLHLLRGGRAAQQQDQPKHLPEDQIQQPQRHDGDRARASERAAHRWSTDVRDILEPHRAGARPVAGSAGGDPGEVHAAAAVLDHHQDVEAAPEDGVDVGEVDGEDRVGLRGEEQSPGGPDRCRAGSMPAVFKIVQTVEAATA
jgi:hypothetical protein